MQKIAPKIPAKISRKNQRKVKRTARIICHNQSEFWTTQAQFWQWIRETKLIKLSDHPLTGRFVNANEESFVVLGNAVLNLVNKNHLKEVLHSRHLMKPR